MKTPSPGPRLRIAPESLVAWADSLPLPAGLEIQAPLGVGHRCTVFRARFEGETVAAKLFNPATVGRNRKRYGVSIARFEHDRNRRFYTEPSLRPYVARPIACFESDDPSANVFLQELLTEPTLFKLLERGRRPSAGFLDELDRMCALSERFGLCDLDLITTNICVRATADGDLPVLFDFNMVPRHERRTNPLVSMLYWSKLRKPNYRDVRRVRLIAEQCRAA